LDLIGSVIEAFSDMLLMALDLFTQSMRCPQSKFVKEKMMSRSEG